MELHLLPEEPNNLTEFSRLTLKLNQQLTHSVEKTQFSYLALRSPHFCELGL